MTGTTQTSLDALIDDAARAATEIRHDIHAHPELKFKEQRTSALVQSELAKLGIQFATDVGGKEPNTGTGVIAHLPATVAQPGPCIALRADMDALPITEIGDLPYKSTNDGVMHACGHDGHTSMLLGAARVLSSIEERPNPITLIFQPAEEGGAGAEKLCRDGLLTGGIIGEPISRVYGFHGWPDIVQGTVATKPGPLLAAADMFTVIVHGKQGHAAYPHESVDPILCGSAIVQNVQSVVSRFTKPTDGAVVSVTTFHAGTAHNIIPAAATLTGTVRTLSEPQRDATQRRLSEIIEHTAAAFGCRAEIEWRRGYPVTMNDPAEAQRVLDIAEGSARADRVEILTEPTLGGEDFAFYAKEIPCCFTFLGLAKDDTTPYAGLHTPGFDFNDAVIPLGIEMMCRLALNPLDR